MRAAVVDAVNAPWRVREVDTPRPGPGEVLIRVHASGVCHNDVLVSRGVFPFPQLDPVVIGHEPAGEVVEVGAGVTTRQVGDRVGATWVQGTCGRCEHCRRDPGLTGRAATSCPGVRMTGLNAPGGHAEYVAVSAASTVLLPEALGYEAAAPMLCAGYTAWSALRTANPRPHERVAVLGIGGLGHLAVQFSRACGFDTVAVTRTPDKHELARKLGADEVVGDGAALRAAGGADVILVTGTSYAAATDALAGLRPRGRMVLAGIDPGGTLAIGPTFPIWSRGQQILGATHLGLDRLGEALDLAAGGAVTPMVETFDADRADEVVRRVERNEVRFRAVLRF
ncbi:alcohol dehydrogenase catalytic domain-containing protein [Micromonospora sp. NPDC050980]|uniref:alcohol dehydrogenase catalytic domain-containing protein n=1 Tax=Micromonospora sp. NPDC050980 TaxID=3155161 RepID=UPI003406CC1D